MAINIVKITESNEKWKNGTLIDVILEDTSTGLQIQATGITYIEDEMLDSIMEEWLALAQQNVKGFTILN